eukprot:s5606_g1.t1
MAISVTVCLLSGEAVSVTLDPSSFLRGRGSLAEAGVQDGDTITVAIQATAAAFAALCADGRVVTWGNPEFGGDSSTVQWRLVDVSQIQSTSGAFAALRQDGTVETWGMPHLGGNCDLVYGKLQNVRQIQANDAAFAALRADGSVVTWGADEEGGNSQEVQQYLHGVRCIQKGFPGFTAIKEHGQVVSWGFIDPDVHLPGLDQAEGIYRTGLSDVKEQPPDS